MAPRQNAMSHFAIKTGDLVRLKPGRGEDNDLRYQPGIVIKTSSYDIATGSRPILSDRLVVVFWSRACAVEPWSSSALEPVL